MKTSVRVLALALLALATPHLTTAAAPHCAEGRRNVIDGVATSDDVHYGSDLTWGGAAEGGERGQQLRIVGCNNTVHGNYASSDIVLVGSDNVLINTSVSRTNRPSFRVTGNDNDIEENHLDYIFIGTLDFADAAKFEHNIIKNNSGDTQLIVKGVVKNMDVEDNRIEKGTFSSEILGYTDASGWHTTDTVTDGNLDYGFEFSDESSDTLVGNDLLHGLRATGSKLNQVLHNIARYISISGGESNTLVGNRIIPANGMTLPDQENFEMVDNKGLHFMGVSDIFVWSCTKGYRKADPPTTCVPCPAGTYWDTGECHACPSVAFTTAPASVLADGQLPTELCSVPCDATLPGGCAGAYTFDDDDATVTTGCAFGSSAGALNAGAWVDGTSTCTDCPAGEFSLGGVATACEATNIVLGALSCTSTTTMVVSTAFTGGESPTGVAPASGDVTAATALVLAHAAVDGTPDCEAGAANGAFTCTADASPGYTCASVGAVPTASLAGVSPAYGCAAGSGTAVTAVFSGGRYPATGEHLSAVDAAAINAALATAPPATVGVRAGSFNSATSGTAAGTCVVTAVNTVTCFGFAAAANHVCDSVGALPARIPSPPPSPPPPSPPPPSPPPPSPPPPAVVTPTGGPPANTPGPATPAPAPAATVTVGLSLAAINPATFNASSVAAGIAAASGVSASDVSVTVYELLVATTFSFANVGLPLTTNQTASLTDAVSVKTSKPANMVRLGKPTAAAGRRLLDISIPVEIFGNGNDTAAATAQTAALVNSINLVYYAASLGAASAAATPVVVTAEVTVVVRAASAAAAAGISTALGSASAISTAIAAAGVPATITISTPPTTVVAVVDAVPSASSDDDQKQKDLLALLVLLILVVAIGGAVADQLRKRRRAAQAQAEADAKEQSLVGADLA